MQLLAPIEDMSLFACRNGTLYLHATKCSLTRSDVKSLVSCLSQWLSESDPHREVRNLHEREDALR